MQIWEDDQGFRTGGRHAAHVEQQNKLDIKNEKIVTRYLDDSGFTKGAYRLVIVYVILHSSLKVQEKYLPMLKAANDPYYAAEIAMLEDRVNVLNGCMQKYGTQLEYENGKYSLSSLANRDSVDVWRKQVGLEPMRVYLKQFGLEWK